MKGHKRFVTIFVLEKYQLHVNPTHYVWEQWEDWPTEAAARRGLQRYKITPKEWGRVWRVVRQTVETVRYLPLEKSA